MPNIVAQIKGKVFDVLQEQAGKFGEGFVNDLTFTVNGSVNIQVTDRSQKKVIFETNIPVKAQGDFTK